MRLLTDENIAPHIASALRTEGWDIISVHEVSLAGKSDEIVFDFAQQENRVVVTQDLDFNTLQRLSRLTTEGLILLRLNNPSPKTLLTLLRRFLQRYNQEDMRNRVASVGSTTRFSPPL